MTEVETIESLTGIANQLMEEPTAPGSIEKPEMILRRPPAFTSTAITVR